MNQAPLLVVGSCNADLMTKVMRHPQPGETVSSISSVRTSGGKGANQAVAARRMGADVYFIGTVGSDPMRAVACAAMDAAGVNTTYVKTGRRTTGLALITVDHNGENTIVVDPGANHETTAIDVPDSLLQACSAIILQMEIPSTTVSTIIDRAYAAGKPVLLNLAPAFALPQETMAKINTLIVNEGEARTLLAAWESEPCDPSLEGTVRHLHGRLGCNVVITCGAERVEAITAEGERWHCTPPSIHSIDTTGAGDAWVGAFAYAFCQARMHFDAALHLATAIGTYACMQQGASLPEIDSTRFAPLSLATKLTKRI